MFLASSRKPHTVQKKKERCPLLRYTGINLPLPNPPQKKKNSVNFGFHLQVFGASRCRQEQRVQRHSENKGASLWHTLRQTQASLCPVCVEKIKMKESGNSAITCESLTHDSLPCPPPVPPSAPVVGVTSEGSHLDLKMLVVTVTYGLCVCSRTENDVLHTCVSRTVKAQEVAPDSCFLPWQRIAATSWGRRNKNKAETLLPIGFSCMTWLKELEVRVAAVCETYLSTNQPEERKRATLRMRRMRVGMSLEPQVHSAVN